MVQNERIKIIDSGIGETLRKSQKGAMNWEERTSEIAA
jgi:hypothetical protein